MPRKVDVFRPRPGDLPVHMALRLAVLRRQSSLKFVLCFRITARTPLRLGLTGAGLRR